MKCPHCGAAVGDNEITCPECSQLRQKRAERYLTESVELQQEAQPQLGDYVKQARAAHISDQTIREQLLARGWSVQIVESCLAVPELTYELGTNAGFWPRFAAFFIDMVLLCVALLVMNVFFGLGIGFASVFWGLDESLFDNLFSLIEAPGPSRAASFIVLILYFGIMNGRYGATLGKMALGLRVVSVTGLRISVGDGLKRAAVQFLLHSFTFGLFYITVAINKEHRGWHDRIAGTRVIYTRRRSNNSTTKCSEAEI
ncbi:MAG: hypothetical protein GX358_07015 [candidate division WS1 bacterium]|jgi:uncharacterized RDD family membrane protein YckC|nr:hypothetical protein [candidate division WS1 bacterium]